MSLRRVGAAVFLVGGFVPGIVKHDRVLFVFLGIIGTFAAALIYMDPWNPQP